jgi:hypothetical protein
LILKLFTRSEEDEDDDDNRHFDFF